MTVELRPPLVTDIDRKWALDQCPAWATLDVADRDDDEPTEIIDETDLERAERMKRKRDKSVEFCWTWFVDDQIDSFERFFCDQRKTYGDWSRLWRLSWWPKADPMRRLPKTVRKLVPSTPHPFARRGEPGFDAGMRVATAQERRVFEKIGIVQFKPDDERAKVLNVTDRVIRNPAGVD